MELKLSSFFLDEHKLPAIPDTTYYTSRYAIILLSLILGVTCWPLAATSINLENSLATFLIWVFSFLMIGGLTYGFYRAVMWLLEYMRGWNRYRVWVAIDDERGFTLRRRGKHDSRIGFAGLYKIVRTPHYYIVMTAMKRTEFSMPYHAFGSRKNLEWFEGLLQQHQVHVENLHSEQAGRKGTYPGYGFFPGFWTTEADTAVPVYQADPIRRSLRAGAAFVLSLVIMCVVFAVLLALAGNEAQNSPPIIHATATRYGEPYSTLDQIFTEHYELLRSPDLRMLVYYFSHDKLAISIFNLPSGEGTIEERQDEALLEVSTIVASAFQTALDEGYYQELPPLIGVAFNSDASRLAYQSAEIRYGDIVAYEDGRIDKEELLERWKLPER